MKRFVTFEGIDGSGKSTISKGVYDALKNRGYDVVFTFEPTDSNIGKCLEKGIDDFDPLTTTFLFIADRIEHVKIIKKWLKQEKIVICDRYMDSTYAYQSAQLESILPSPLDFLKNISEDFILVPDRTFLFDIDVKDALTRIKDRNNLESFEREDFLRKVRENYLNLAESDKRFMILDAKESIEQLIEICIRDILGDAGN